MELTLKSLEWLRNTQFHLVWSKQGKDSERDLCFLYSVQESKSLLMRLLWAVQNTPLWKVRSMINFRYRKDRTGMSRGGAKMLPWSEINALKHFTEAKMKPRQLCIAAALPAGSHLITDYNSFVHATSSSESATHPTFSTSTAAQTKIHH